MEHNFTFVDTTSALPQLLRELNTNGETVVSRAGKTHELTHVGITIEEPWRKEILVPGRKASIAAQIAETAWVLAGRDDIDWLMNYMPRARDFSDDGKTWRGAYGKRLRDWHGIDQLKHVVDILRADPGSRQAVAVLYDPSVDSEPGKDIPCNNWLSFLNRDGALDLHVAVRSNDVMWGWSGINTFEWSTLLEVVAGLTGAEVGMLHFSVTSFHLYERHWTRAEKIVQECARTTRVEVYDSPRFEMPRLNWLDLDALLEQWFSVEYDIRTGSPLAWGYIDNFPEPMLRSWLKVLDWWWNGQHNGSTLDSIRDTALGAACAMGIRPGWDKTPLVERKPDAPSSFLVHAIHLHNEKHAAYGDSWKRRGEMLGILANIARKVDRLGGGETSDETSADTALDLMVYLAKYRTWLDDNPPEMIYSDDPIFANSLLVSLEKDFPSPYEDLSIEVAEGILRSSFDLLEKAVRSDNQQERLLLVDDMLRVSYQLAHHLYEKQEQRAPYEAVLEATFGDDYAGADHD